MTSTFDTSNYIPVSCTIAYGDQSHTKTVFIEPGTDRTDVARMLNHVAADTLTGLYREWNEFR